MYRWFVKQWLESNFAERISIMGREHNVLVARLKREIEAMLAARKLQERDFSTLPGTWERLEKANGLWIFLVSPKRHQIDVKYMDMNELDELMGGMDWFQSEINRVKSIGGFSRQKEFDDIRMAHHLRRLKDACREFDSYVAANAIFYPPEFLIELKSIGATFQAAVAETEQAEASRDKDEVPALPSQIDDSFRERVDAIAVAIRKKLESHEQVAAP